jgi:hypothetical protein
VRTNLILQSNSFDTTWVNSNTTETGGQAGYDGTNNAWLLTTTLAGGFIAQSVAISGLTTFSVYAKAGTQNGIILYSAHVGQGINFNLSTGVVGPAFVAPTLGSRIDSIGNGWYRCSITISSSSTSAFRLYVGNGSDVSVGNVVIQNSQAETGDIATDYIATTTAAVSVGPVSGLPRLDYLGSSCPRLILEGQRTNLALYSEQFDDVYWTKTNATISANATTSPDGYANADSLIDNTTNAVHRINTGNINVTSANAYTLSFFVKKGYVDYVHVEFPSAEFGSNKAVFNIDNGTITSETIANSAKIESYINGWYRCSLTLTATSSGAFAKFYINPSTSSTSTSYIGTNSVSVYLYGAQLEASASYATSYIPTLGAAVTRLADSASKTGISSFIGQTEGTLFLEITTTDDITTVTPIGISDGTGSNRVLIYVGSGIVIALVTVSGVAQATISSSSISANTRYKMAIAYKANDFAFYVNGVQIGTDTNGTVPACSKFNYDNGSGSAPFYGLNNQALLFKTRLSNAKLAELTTL